MSNKLLNDCPNEKHFNIHVVNCVDYFRYLGLILIVIYPACKFPVNCVNNKIITGVSLLEKRSHFTPDECLCSIHFAVIYPYLQLGTEFRATGCNKQLYIMLILQNTAIWQIACAYHRDHCAPVAKQLGICSFTIYIDSLFVRIGLKCLIFISTPPLYLSYFLHKPFITLNCMFESPFMLNILLFIKVLAVIWNCLSVATKLRCLLTLK